MRLDIDCVRAVLLQVEQTPFDTFIRFDDFCNEIPNFSNEQISYTCLKLQEGRYIHLVTEPQKQSAVPRIVTIIDLTFSGHEFLESIRNEEQFSKSKKICAEAGRMGLSFLGFVAKTVTEASINALIQKYV